MNLKIVFGIIISGVITSSIGQAQINNSARFDSLEFFRSQFEESLHLDTLIMSKCKQGIESLIKNSNNKNFNFIAYRQLAEFNSKEGLPKIAIQNYYKALEYSDFVIDKTIIPSVYEELVRVYLYIGSYDRIKECIERAVELREEIGDKFQIYRTKLLLCSYYRRIGNYIGAFRIGYEVLNYYETVNDSLGIARSYNLLAMTYKSLESYEKAIVMYNRSYDYYNIMGITKGRAAVLNNLGNVYFKLEEYQKALELYNKCLAMKEGEEEHEKMVQYNNIALVYAHIKNFDPALELLRFCYSENKQLMRSAKLANTCQSIGECFEIMNVIDSAKYYYFESLELCKKHNLNSLHMKLASSLNKIFEKEGDIKNAYQFQKKYNELHEQMDYSKILSQVSIEELRYMNLKDKRIKGEIRKKNLLLIIIIAFFFILLILISWNIIIKQKAKIQKSVQTKKDMERINMELVSKIDFQNKELLSKLLQLNDGNSDVKQTIQKLKKLRSDLGINSKHKVQLLINDLERSVNETIWTEFEYRFNIVHQDFYKKLATKHPNLTVGDRRHCALIHLNFTSKEIAYITKQTYKSVWVAKSRLRNKLNLDDSIKIANYLNTMI